MVGEHNPVRMLNAVVLPTLKGLILCYRNFMLAKKKKSAGKVPKMQTIVFKIKLI